jgi:hypothetical protein
MAQTLTTLEIFSIAKIDLSRFVPIVWDFSILFETAIKNKLLEKYYLSGIKCPNRD